MNDHLNVVYLQDSVTVKRIMDQIELAELLLYEDVILISVNAPKIYQKIKKKNNGCLNSNK